MEQPKQECLFRRFEAASEGDMDPDVTQALANPQQRACAIGECALTGQHLYDYMTAFGGVQPRADINKAVATDCMMLEQ